MKNLFSLRPLQSQSFKAWCYKEAPEMDVSRSLSWAKEQNQDKARKALNELSNNTVESVSNDDLIAGLSKIKSSNDLAGRADRITLIQIALDRLGKNPGTIDGIYSSQLVKEGLADKKD
jgi:hypothetical protein